MTCTHAALKRRQLVELGFQYDNILMEEAAQILEIETFIPLLLQNPEHGHNRLKRWIMIGDHNQLPPIIKNTAFQKYGNMEQSLFKRFIRLGVPAINLDAQGRSRPTLCSLFKWRYKILNDLEHVKNEQVYLKANAGFVYEYQFINVDDLEGVGETEPIPYFYQNEAEAEFVILQFIYMRLIGYPAEKITILTTYNGQKQKIKEVLNDRLGTNEFFGQPSKITTVDKYQGMQNDYIILSLVRTKAVGHLRDIRRLVVAMSRARLGLYIYGKFNLFKNCLELQNVFNILNQRPKELSLFINEDYLVDRNLNDHENGKLKVIKTLKEMTDFVLGFYPEKLEYWKKVNPQYVEKITKKNNEESEEKSNDEEEINDDGNNTDDENINNNVNGDEKMNVEENMNDKENIVDDENMNDENNLDNQTINKENDLCSKISSSMVKKQAYLSVRIGQIKAQSCHLRELDLCAATLLVFTQNPSALQNGDLHKAMMFLEVQPTVSVSMWKRLIDSATELKNYLVLERSLAATAVKLLNEQKQFVRAFSLVKDELAMNEEDTKEIFFKLGTQFEKDGKLKDAEKIYLLCDQADKAISMYKDAKQYDSMIRLVSQYYPDLLIETHRHLAKDLEKDKLYSKAELHYISANEWKSAVQMYKNLNRWEDAYRLARLYGGNTNAVRQIALLWAKYLPSAEEAVKMLNKYGLLSQVIDEALSNELFEFACVLAESVGGNKLNEIYLKWALKFEEEENYEKAEKLYLAANKPREAVLMYVNTEQFEKAVKVAEKEVKDENLVRELLTNEAKNILSKNEKQLNNEDNENTKINILKNVEKLLVRANKIELIINLYTKYKLYNEALRLSEQQASYLLPTIKREMAMIKENEKINQGNLSRNINIDRPNNLISKDEDTTTTTEAETVTTVKPPSKKINWTEIELKWNEVLDDDIVHEKWKKLDENLKSVLDAIGKPTAGVLDGAITMFGNYHQCLNIRAYDDDEELDDFFDSDEPKKPVERKCIFALWTFQWFCEKNTDPNDYFLNSSEGSKINDFDDELNDETFGAPVVDDWEATHEELATLEEENLNTNNINGSKNNIEKKPINDNEDFIDENLIKSTMSRVASHNYNQFQYHNFMQQMYLPQQIPIQLMPQNIPQIIPHQFPMDLQHPPFLRFPPPVVPPNLQFPYLNNNINLNENPGLNESFASMNLKEFPRLNPESQNLNFSERQNVTAERPNNILENGNNENKPTTVKRALTLEELEKSFIVENRAVNQSPKKITVKDLESTFFTELKNKPQTNLLNYKTTDKKLIKNNMKTQKNPKQEFSQNFKEDYQKQPQLVNMQNNRNRNNKSNNQNYKNNHESMIPNPLNPLEMISNTMNNNHNYKYNDNHKNNFESNNYKKNHRKNDGDEYDGLMTRKDINWLKRVQLIQLDFSDPYVQDYYFVNYQTKKIREKLKKRDKINGQDHTAPQLVIPETANKAMSTCSEAGFDTSRYKPPDCSGSLGKIRALNVNYPRKQLDFNNKLEKLTKNSENATIEPCGRTELNKFRKLLLDIEKNLTNVLKIDHEDKKIAALPMEAQSPHLEERKRLCTELFNGILTTPDHQNVNFQIANVRKGCMLIFKSLQVLEDPEMKTVIISDLLKAENFHHVVMQKDKTLYCLDYGQLLIDAIQTIKNCNFSLLLRIAEGLDDASVVAKFQFLERVLEDVDDISHLRKLCNDHIIALSGQA
ncbi:hypothetical protein RND71_043341 [Anisodus tanguticus]|uniref:Uncharacterized protein n=1 Tax=Anisodus tanguticus TaxID=243964 RepID=A0AAE1QP91_9SOLA|nr:hypothetical protein RND71_043341 [Anisodus tanguticus]